MPDTLNTIHSIPVTTVPLQPPVTATPDTTGIVLPTQADTNHLSATDTTAIHAYHRQPAYYKPTYIDGLPDTASYTTHHIRQLNEYTLINGTTGKEPETYMPSPARSTGILLLLLAVFLFVSFCYKKGGKYLNSIFTNIWSVKRRKNHLDDHTMSETLIMIALIVQTIVMEGIILYYGIAHFNPSALSGGNISAKVGMTVTVAVFYYLLQFGLFRMIGYVFSTKDETMFWIKGFNASQSLMGMTLAPVAVLLLFMPNYNETLIFIATILYVIARLAFLIKSFRIFFNKIFQCVYFILYLCAVEIVPLIFSYKGVLLVYNSLEIYLK